MKNDILNFFVAAKSSEIRSFWVQNTNRRGRLIFSQVSQTLEFYITFEGVLMPLYKLFTISYSFRDSENQCHSSVHTWSLSLSTYINCPAGIQNSIEGKANCTNETTKMPQRGVNWKTAGVPDGLSSSTKGHKRWSRQKSTSSTYHYCITFFHVIMFKEDMYKIISLSLVLDSLHF